MTLEQAIKQFKDNALIYSRNAVSKEYYNPKAAEEDRQAAEEYRQVSEWLEELKEYRQQPKTGHWIPVSERLPEENGQYLITVKYKPEEDYENIYAEHGEWADGRWDMFCFGHCGEVEGIVAWMPLPEPYKAESEE